MTIAAAFAEAERERIRERIGQVNADQKARAVISAERFRIASVAAMLASSSSMRLNSRLSEKDSLYEHKETR